LFDSGPDSTLGLVVIGFDDDLLDELATNPFITNLLTGNDHPKAVASRWVRLSFGADRRGGRQLAESRQKM